MTDAPTPDRPEDQPRLAGDDGPMIDAREDFDRLDRISVPATLRRAPRLGRMLGTGIGIGVGLGLILGFSLPNSTGVGRGMVAVIVALGLGLAGALIAGTIATRADASSSADADARRARDADAWLAARDPGEDPAGEGEAR